MLIINSILGISNILIVEKNDIHPTITVATVLESQKSFFLIILTSARSLIYLASPCTLFSLMEN